MSVSSHSDRGTWIFLAIAVSLIGVLAWARFLRPPAPVPDAFDTGVTLQTAMDASADTGKPVLAFATADWCQACQAFKRGALSSSAVSDYIETNTQPVYLDLTDSSDSQVTSTAQSLAVRSLPSLIMIVDGEVVSRLEGAYAKDEVLEWLSRSGAIQQASAAGG